jgi:hypothetical protein
VQVVEPRSVLGPEVEQAGQAARLANVVHELLGARQLARLLGAQGTAAGGGRGRGRCHRPLQHLLPGLLDVVAGGSGERRRRRRMEIGGGGGVTRRCGRAGVPGPEPAGSWAS